MGFSIDTGLSAATVFLQGLLSFFSPCVLPLIPLYMGYLSGGTVIRGEDGQMHYPRGKVLFNTLFFVLGISFAFFVLGFGMTAVGRFLGEYQIWLSRAGGVLIILFGLFQLGVFGSPLFLNKERRLPISLEKMAMSPLTALIMGFTFSFAWTPCVGPTLSAVLLMAASAGESSTGYLLVGVYTAGFVIPFLLAGLFTTSILELFRKHRSVVRYTVKVGGGLLVVMGVLMLAGKMNGISGYFSSLGQEVTENLHSSETAADTKQSADEQEEAAAENLYHAPDFTLTDQYGNSHTLSDYQGKVVFLNFWATWCPPCRAEMPDIQALYEEYQSKEDPEVVILGVAFPGYGNEQDEDGVKAFLSENGYTYPVVMDSGAELMAGYSIMAYPTTFMIDRDGNLFGYVTGSMDKHVMQSIIDQTIAGRRE